MLKMYLKSMGTLKIKLASVDRIFPISAVGLLFWIISDIVRNIRNSADNIPNWKHKRSNAFISCYMKFRTSPLKQNYLKVATLWSLLSSLPCPSGHMTKGKRLHFVPSKFRFQRNFFYSSSVR